MPKYGKHVEIAREASQLRADVQMEITYESFELANTARTGVYCAAKRHYLRIGKIRVKGNRVIIHGYKPEVKVTGRPVVTECEETKQQLETAIRKLLNRKEGDPTNFNLMDYVKRGRFSVDTFEYYLNMVMSIDRLNVIRCNNSRITIMKKVIPSWYSV